MPQLIDYQIDKALSKLSYKYENHDYVADLILPRLTVSEISGKYHKYNKDRFKPVDSRREGIARAHRVDYGMELADYGPLVEHSLENGLPWKLIDTYPDEFSAEADATENVSERLLVENEIAVAAMLSNTANIGGYVTLSGTDQFSDQANSNPLAVIDTAVQYAHAQMGAVNTALMSFKVFRVLRRHPHIMDYFNIDARSSATKEQLKEVLEVENLIIAGALKNEANEGQTDDMDYIWGNHILFAYVAPRPQIGRRSFGYTFQLDGARVIDKWDEKEVKARFVRATDNYQNFIVDKYSAYLIKDVIASE